MKGTITVRSREAVDAKISTRKLRNTMRHDPMRHIEHCRN